MKRLLDTNVCIAYLNGQDESIRQKFMATPPQQLTLCSIVRAELLYGARYSQQAETNLVRLAQFFTMYPSAPFDDIAAEHYGLLRSHLRRAGTPVGGNDLLIAAIALASDYILVTRNVREFSQIPGLRWETW